jgi:hypothetical protein
MADKTAIEWADAHLARDYEVSADGQVRSWRNRHGGRRDAPVPLRPMAQDGYLYVLLSPVPGAHHRKRFVHRLVLESFIGPCPPGQEVRHRNGDRTDNRLANLAWGDRYEQAADRHRHGTESRGERAGGSRLTETQVIEARCRREAGEPLRAIARDLGVSHTAIRRATDGTTWRHVEHG